MVGLWDPRIFTAQWVGNGRLTAERNLEITIPIEDASAPRTIGFDGILLEVHASRLTIKVTRPDDDLLRRIKTCALRLLSDLSYVPLVAVGINFAFEDPAPTPELVRLFDLSDAGKLAENGWSIQNTMIKRELKSQQYILNLIGAVSKGSVRFDLNYHFAAATTQTSVGILQLDLVSLKNDAQGLISRLYYPAL